MRRFRTEIFSQSFTNPCLYTRSQHVGRIRVSVSVHEFFLAAAPITKRIQSPYEIFADSYKIKELAQLPLIINETWHGTKKYPFTLNKDILSVPFYRKLTSFWIYFYKNPFTSKAERRTRLLNPCTISVAREFSGKTPAMCYIGDCTIFNIFSTFNRLTIHVNKPP